MAPLRVLLISHSYYSPYNRGKVRHLAAHPDVQLHLAAIPTIWRGGNPFPYQTAAADQYPQHLLPSLFPSRNILRVFSPATLIPLLRRIRPHIVHIEIEPHALSLMEVLLLRFTAGYRVLFFTWENIDRSLAWPLRRIEAFNLRHADGAIAGNQGATGVLRRRGFRGPIEVIPQIGIDPATWEAAMPAPTWAALRERGPVVGFLGRLVPEKGIPDLIEAFAQLPQAWNAQLLIVGGGRCRDELEAGVKALGIDRRVHFTGAVPFGETPAYLKCMDVMVLPSHTTPKWKEQFGHVLIEAMACHIPVIGADSGAIPDVIADAGLIYPEGDILALQKCLSELLQDSSLRDRLRERGRERVAAHYTDAILAERTVQVYRQLECT